MLHLKVFNTAMYKFMVLHQLCTWINWETARFSVALCLVLYLLMIAKTAPLFFLVINLEFTAQKIPTSTCMLLVEQLLKIVSELDLHRSTGAIKIWSSISEMQDLILCKTIGLWSMISIGFALMNNLPTGVLLIRISVSLPGTFDSVLVPHSALHFLPYC